MFLIILKNKILNLFKYDQKEGNIIRKFDYVETHITNHCNLNCISCTHYAPLAEPWFKDINEYVKEIAKLAEIAKSSLREVRILGGEPLLHPQALDFLYITRKAFPDANVELVTNGLLLPKMPDKFFKEINRNDISIYLSNYTESNYFINILEEKVNHYRMGQKDYFIRPGLDLHGSDKEKNFTECYEAFQSPCYNLRNGYLFHCPTEAYFDFFMKYFNISVKGMYNVYDNGLNIFNATLTDIEKYINMPSDFCRFCELKNKPTISYALSQKHAIEWLA